MSRPVSAARSYDWDVSEPQSSQIRVGDAEREQALQALGDHMTAGRLDIDEYGERTARVAAAKTRGDLVTLFSDLPEPKPRFGPPVKSMPAVPRQNLPAEPPPGPAAERWQARPVGQRLYAALVPVSFIVAAAIFFFVARVWPVFLLPVALTIIGGNLWGDDWSRDRRAWQREQRHRRRRHWDDRH
jgi:Domain of unknown function (DUF1707)